MVRFSELLSTVSTNSSNLPAWRFSFRGVSIALFSILFACAGFAQGNACLPSGTGVQICQPASASTVGSVVTIIAGAVAQSGNITAIRAYIDDVPVFTVDNPATTNSFQVAQDANVDAGNRHLVVVGYQDDGGSVVADTFFNSATAVFTNCDAPSQPGAVFCHPGISRVISPIQISAAVSSMSGYITAIRLYVDSTPELTVNNPQPSQTFAINEPLVFPHDLDPSTTHTMTLVGYDSLGGAVTATHPIPQGGFNMPVACEAPGSPGVNVCSPQPNSCTTSGLYWIHATGTGATGPVDHMELWTDSGKVADFPGNSINTNIGPPLAGGMVTLTIVVVDSNGQFMRSDPITVFVC